MLVATGTTDADTITCDDITNMVIATYTTDLGMGMAIKGAIIIEYCAGAVRAGGYGLLA